MPALYVTRPKHRCFLSAMPYERHRNRSVSQSSALLHSSTSPPPPTSPTRQLPENKSPIALRTFCPSLRQRDAALPLPYREHGGESGRLPVPDSRGSTTENHASTKEATAFGVRILAVLAEKRRLRQPDRRHFLGLRRRGRRFGRDRARQDGHGAQPPGGSAPLATKTAPPGVAPSEHAATRRTEASPAAPGPPSGPLPRRGRRAPSRSPAHRRGRTAPPPSSRRPPGLGPHRPAPPAAPEEAAGGGARRRQRARGFPPREGSVRACALVPPLASVLLRREGGRAGAAVVPPGLWGSGRCGAQPARPKATREGLPAGTATVGVNAYLTVTYSLRDFTCAKPHL